MKNHKQSYVPVVILAIFLFFAMRVWASPPPDLKNAPKIPPIKCKASKSYSLTIPPNFWLGIIDIPIDQKKSIIEFEKQGYIAQSVFLGENETHTSASLNLSKISEKGKPSKESVTIDQQTAQWLAYTTNEKRIEMVEKGLDFGFFDIARNKSQKQQTIKFSCTYSKVVEEPRPTEETPPPIIEEIVPEEEKLPELKKNISESQEAKIKKQLHGVWYTKMVESGKGGGALTGPGFDININTYLTFVNDKICRSTFMDAQNELQCQYAYVPYELIDKNTLVFDDKHGPRQIWKFTLRGAVFEEQRTGETKTVWKKANTPITERIVQDSMTPKPRISNIQVKKKKVNSVTISWTTDVPAQSWMTFTKEGSGGSLQTARNGRFTKHAETFHVDSRTIYSFKIYAESLGGEGESREKSFTTE